MASSSDSFEDVKFMKDLVSLKDTQEAVQSLSGWCIRNRKFSYKIARCWLKCSKKVKTDQRLTLFHLVNDIVQHSKRKNYSDILEKFEPILKEIMPYLKEEKISTKVQRCLDIWMQRNVFSEAYIRELSTIISSKKQEHDILENFQSHQLCTQIKILRALEDDTEYKLKTILASDFNPAQLDDDAIRQTLKDRHAGGDFINNVDQAMTRLEDFIKAIEREIAKRRNVIELLQNAVKYYDNLGEEVNIVASAYSTFGNRLKSVQAKLVNEVIPKFGVKDESRESLLAAADLSPIPSPDVDAPSPEAGELELELPDENPAVLNESMDLNTRLESIRSKLFKEEAPGNGYSAESKVIELESDKYNPPNLKPHHIELSAPLISSLIPMPPYDPSQTEMIRSAITTSSAVYPPQEQEISWWDPPPATAWPAPKPDTWVDPSTNWESEPEPIPEWKVQTEDVFPEEEIGEVYTNNLAMERLRHRGGNFREDSNNLISLTSNDSKKLDVSRSTGGSEDMELSSDEEDRTHRSSHNSFSHQSHRQMFKNEKFLNHAHERRLSESNSFEQSGLGDRLRSLAGGYEQTPFRGSQPSAFRNQDNLSKHPSRPYHPPAAPSPGFHMNPQRYRSDHQSSPYRPPGFGNSRGARGHFRGRGDGPRW